MLTKLVVVSKSNRCEFNNSFLFTEGQEYNALVTRDNLVIISIGGIFAIEDVESIKHHFVISETDMVSGIDGTDFDSMGKYLKELNIRNWYDNSDYKNSVFKVKANRECIAKNDSGFQGSGKEYFVTYETFIGIDLGDCFAIQKRKGAIFYLNKEENKENFTIDYFNNEDETYDNLKEIQYIVNNNYRKELAEI